jgi:hypothetical protein
MIGGLTRIGSATRAANAAKRAEAAATGVQRKTLGQRIRGVGAGLANLGFGIGQWADLFARYYPSLSNTVRVKVQGSPTAPGNTVVQMALAAAYGLVRTNKLCRIELAVQLNHTANECELELKVINLAFLDALESAMRQFEVDDQGKGPVRRTAEGILDVASELIPGDVDLAEFSRDLGKTFAELEAEKERREKAKQQAEFEKNLPPPPGPGPLAGVAREFNRQKRAMVPGLTRVGGPNDQKQPPQVKTNLDAGDVDPAAGALVRKTLQLYKAVSSRLGQDIIYRMGRHRILGGPAPSVLAPQAAKAVGPLAGVAREIARRDIAPFRDMVGQTLLTREPAPNPQPPAGAASVTGLNGLGTDLRTLVAQALHDPGIRPPYPRTDAGPTPILNEERGI